MGGISVMPVASGSVRMVFLSSTWISFDAVQDLRLEITWSLVGEQKAENFLALSPSFSIRNSTQSASASNANSEILSNGSKAGIAVGATIVMILGVINLLAMLHRKRARRKRRNSEPVSEKSESSSFGNINEERRNISPMSKGKEYKGESNGNHCTISIDATYEDGEKPPPITEIGEGSSRRELENKTPPRHELAGVWGAELACFGEQPRISDDDVPLSPADSESSEGSQYSTGLFPRRAPVTVPATGVEDAYLDVVRAVTVREPGFDMGGNMISPTFGRQEYVDTNIIWGVTRTGFSSPRE